MSIRSKKKTVYVAMSGGVDSSVAAALLKKSGFNVVGVFMKPWQPSVDDKFCLWKEDREDALRVAALLEIPLLTWDFSKEYKKMVADYMIREYKSGRTPNPDVMCNKDIKFGVFLKKALKERADFIATGHYVRIAPAQNLKKGKNYRLLTAIDKNKDQSYFLWTLTQEQLKYCLFPVGDYKKSEVRKIAKRLKLPTAEKKDSQGVCFVGELNMHDFLARYIKSRPGNIVDENGSVVGQHDGTDYYTIGQRHGLNITGGQGPYYVLKKDKKRNIIFVGPENKLDVNSARVKNISWIKKPDRFPVELSVKFRYRANAIKAFLYSGGILKLKESERAITAGQSAVFYSGENLLGGGIINEQLPLNQ